MPAILSANKDQPIDGRLCLCNKFVCGDAALPGNRTDSVFYAVKAVGVDGGAGTSPVPSALARQPRQVAGMRRVLQVVPRQGRADHGAFALAVNLHKAWAHDAQGALDVCGVHGCAAVDDGFEGAFAVLW